VVVALATLTLSVAEAASIKDRRRVARSVVERVRSRFNVAVAEIDPDEPWNTVTLGVACISTESGHAHAVLEKVVGFIEGQRLDAELTHYRIEIL